MFLLQVHSLFRLPDKVIAFFFKFLKAFFKVVGQSCSLCAGIAKTLPSSLYKAKNTFMTKPNIRRYVVCRKCHTLYYMKDIVVTLGSVQSGKNCSFQKFPHHPQSKHQKSCGLPLVKTVELAGGKRVLYPHMVYCYLGVEQLLCGCHISYC